jgi:hypothetical protein
MVCSPTMALRAGTENDSPFCHYVGFGSRSVELFFLHFVKAECR